MEAMKSPVCLSHIKVQKRFYDLICWLHIINYFVLFIPSPLLEMESAHG
jgi:hypothetical protein